MRDCRQLQLLCWKKKTEVRHLYHKTPGQGVPHMQHALDPFYTRGIPGTKTMCGFVFFKHYCYYDSSVWYLILSALFPKSFHIIELPAHPLQNEARRPILF